MSKGDVQCMNCGHRQDDRGQRATCERCGTAPMPSFSYHEGHVCHPSHPRVEKPTVREIVSYAKRQREILQGR